MRRERVQSDALRSVGYDPGRHILEIEFNSGKVYRYFEVPENVHSGLMTAQSHGQFFADNIRDAGFDFEQRD